MLTQKERLFCRLRAAGADRGRAAACAGYTKAPFLSAVKLESREEIRREISAQREKLHTGREEIAQACRSLAFSSAADAVALALSDTPPSKEELEKMDLSLISEIKRPKGGGLEIKFFDRLKALSLMNEMIDDSQLGAAEFLTALKSSAGDCREAAEEENGDDTKDHGI